MSETGSLQHIIKLGRILLVLSGLLVFMAYAGNTMPKISVSIWGLTIDDIKNNIVINSALFIVALYFFFSFYVHQKEYGDLGIVSRFKHDFHSILANISRKKKMKLNPDLYTPQYLPSPTDKYYLSWNCKYCQAIGDFEPSITIKINPSTTIMIVLKSVLNLIMRTTLILNFILPFVMFSVAFFIFIYNALKIILERNI